MSSNVFGLYGIWYGMVCLPIYHIRVVFFLDLEKWLFALRVKHEIRLQYALQRNCDTVFLNGMVLHGIACE